MTTDLIKVDPFSDHAVVLAGNSFGILESDGTTEEKIGRLLALIPVALEIVDEARRTIRRLREENEEMITQLASYDPEVKK